MSQLEKRWLADNAVDHTKLEPNDFYTMGALDVTSNLIVGNNLVVGGTVYLPDTTVSNSLFYTASDATIGKNFVANGSLTFNSEKLTHTAILTGPLTLYNQGSWHYSFVFFSGGCDQTNSMIISASVDSTGVSELGRVGEKMYPHYISETSFFRCSYMYIGEVIPPWAIVLRFGNDYAPYVTSYSIMLKKLF
jgi:hypothetical protein